ncbi:MAG: hypothetical protein JEZ03_02840 [Bacteroidales bacterium]|nr:hypothetical protein [Bacteroidales bacterium]
MASRRELKRDIKYLVSDVIEECYGFIAWHPKADHVEASKIINEAVELHDEMIDRVNHPDGKDNPKIVKAYFTKIRKDLFSTTASIFAKIEKMFNEADKAE